MNEWPWPHLVIDNFLTEEDFEMHCREAVRKCGKSKPDGVRMDIDHDPLVKYNMWQYFDQFTKKRKLKPEEEYCIHSHYTLLEENFVYKIHTDVGSKVMSAILYLAPEHNIGTRLYTVDQNDLAIEISWKPNRMFIFCGISGETWHDFISSSERYTLNWFITRPY